MIWAEYAGGDVVRGHLVGTRRGDRLDFRYVQLKHDGTTSSGHCVSTVVELPDGRVRLEETLGVGVAGRAAGRALWNRSLSTTAD